MTVFDWMRLNLKADTEYFECKKIIIEQKQVRFSRIKGIQSLNDGSFAKWKSSTKLVKNQSSSPPQPPVL